MYFYHGLLFPSICDQFSTWLIHISSLFSVVKFSLQVKSKAPKVEQADDWPDKMFEENTQPGSILNLKP